MMPSGERAQRLVCACCDVVQMFDDLNFFFAFSASHCHIHAKSTFSNDIRLAIHTFFAPSTPATGPRTISNSCCSTIPHPLRSLYTPASNKKNASFPFSLYFPIDLSKPHTVLVVGLRFLSDFTAFSPGPFLSLPPTSL